MRYKDKKHLVSLPRVDYGRGEAAEEVVVVGAPR